MENACELITNDIKPKSTDIYLNAVQENESAMLARARKIQDREKESEHGTCNVNKQLLRCIDSLHFSPSVNCVFIYFGV